MATLASLVVELTANTARFQREMGEAVNHAKRSASQIQSSLAGIQSSFTSTIATVRNLAAAFGLVTSVGGLVALGRNVLAFADNLDEMSARLGINVENLQGLQFAARQSGVSVEQLERGIKTLSGTVAEAAEGNLAAVQKFRDLGVSIDDGTGRVANFEIILGRVADRVAAATSPIEKIGIASKAFGDRVGTYLIPILSRGAAGLAEFQRAAREAGVVISAEMIAQAGKAKDQLDAMGTAIMANLIPAIVAVSPLLIKMAQGLSDIAAAAGRAFGSFGPAVTQSTETLQARLTQIDADLKQRRDFLQKLREENEAAREAGGFRSLFPKSPGALPHEIQRLQLEREAVAAELARRQGAQGASTRGTVIGGGEGALRALDDLKKKLLDSTSADAVVKQVREIEAETAKLVLQYPAIATQIRAINDARIESLRLTTRLVGESEREDAQIKELAESMREVAQEWGGFEGGLFPGATEQRLAQTRGEIIADQEAIDKLTQSMAEVTAEWTGFESGLAGTTAGLKAVRDPLVEVETAFQRIRDEAQVFGESFGTLAARADVLRDGIRQLLDLGFEPMSEEVQRLKSQLDDLQRLSMLEQPFRDVFGALDQALTQSIAGVIQGTQTLEQAFQNMGQSIALSLVNQIIKRGINVVLDALLGLVAQMAASGLSGGGAGAGLALGGYGPAFAAEGAYVKGSSRGSLLVAGEGGRDELVFPLDRAPVDVGGGWGDSTIIINNNAGAQVSASEQQTPDGRKIEIMVDRIVTDGFSSGRYGGVLSSTYGLQRKGRV